jgi:hypothetical protein
MYVNAHNTGPNSIISPVTIKMGSHNEISQHIYTKIQDNNFKVKPHELRKS